MDLIFKGKPLSYKQPFKITCSDGKEYLCKYEFFPNASFCIYESDEPVVEGSSSFSAEWHVKDSRSGKTLFTTSSKWGHLVMNIGDKKIKEKEFSTEFGWYPISCSGFYTWGLEFPKKDKYLLELAYGYLKDNWGGD